MTNFLVSEMYNPGIIYGGGTKNYFGLDYMYGIAVSVCRRAKNNKSSK